MRVSSNRPNRVVSAQGNKMGPQLTNPEHLVYPKKGTKKPSNKLATTTEIPIKRRLGFLKKK